jgi:MFS family permease
VSRVTQELSGNSLINYQGNLEGTVRFRAQSNSDFSRMSKSLTIGTTEAGFRNRRLVIGLYAGSVFLYWISLYLYVPTLPIYAQSKTNSLALVGLILSMYGLWQAVIRLPYGMTADWLGHRKPLIVVGAGLAGFGSWIMGAAGNASELMVGRAITGFAACAWVPFVAVFSSLFPRDEAVRATILLTLISNVGQMLAMSATGWLNELGGYPLAFNLASGAALLAVLIVLPAKEERFPPQQRSIRGFGHLITRRDVLVPSLLAAVSQYARYATVYGFLPILARQLGATDVTQSILAVLSIGVATLGNLMSTVFVKRIGPRSLVYLSFLLISVGMGGAALASSLSIVFFAQFCIGLSQGIGYPVLMGMSIELVENPERTTAMGLHQAVYAIGMFAGPWVSGMLVDAIGIHETFGVTGFACFVLGMLGALKLIKGRK